MWANLNRKSISCWGKSLYPIASLSIILVLSLIMLISGACSATPITPTSTATETVTVPPLILQTKTSTTEPTPLPTLVPASIITPTYRPSPIPSSTKTPLTPTRTVEPPLLETGLVILYYGSDGHLYRTNSEGSIKQQLTSIPDQSEEGAYIFYRPPRVSPDGRWLALNGGWGGAALLNMLEGGTIGVGRGGAMQSPVWSPDSRYIAYLARDNRLCLASVPDLMGDCPFQGAGQSQEAIWSPDGSLIAVASIHPTGENEDCCTGEVTLFNLADRSAKVIGTYATTFEPIAGEALSWLPDGSGLLIKNAVGGGSAIFMTDTGMTVSFVESIADTSLDGRYFLTSSGILGTIEQPALYTLPFDESSCEDDDTVLTSWSWSLDGQRLAYSMDCREQESMSQLYVVEIGTGHLLWKRSLGKNISSVEWAPDGDYLLLQLQSSGLLRDASIQRLAADGAGELETIVEQGYLLGIVPQWGKP